MRAITFAELKEMTTQQQAMLVSIVCKHKWNFQEPRFKCIGISDVSFTKNTKLGRATGREWELQWSDEGGDPTLYPNDLNTKIDGYTDDGRWFYGLYLKE